MNKRQITKTLKTNEIEMTNITISGNEIEVFVEDGNSGVANEDATEELMEKVSAALGFGGWKTGYGSWILEEGYVVNNYDYATLATRCTTKMTKREITPHKGGRTERLYLRTTPEVKRKAKQIAAQTGRSVADVFETFIEQETKMGTVTANFARNAGNFTIDEARYDAIVEQSDHSEEWVNSALFYDWDNADEHQEWLNEADIPEIVAWVDELVDSWK